MNKALPRAEVPRSGSVRPRAAWSIVGLLMALCFISHMNRVGMSIAADERIMAEYGISPTRMGTVYSAFLLVYTIFMLPGGIFIDRFGVRIALAVMGFATAVLAAITGAIGLISVAYFWLALIAVRSVMGFFTTPLHPGCARGIGAWVPAEKRSLANGFVTGAALLGIACTPLAFGELIDRIGWRLAFVVTGSATAAITVLFWLVSARRAHEAAPAPSATRLNVDWNALLGSPSLVLLALSYAAIGYFQYLFFYWMHYYFDEIRGMAESRSRLFSGLPVFAMALAMPVGGWLSDRVEARYGWRAGRSLVAGGAMIGAVIFLGIGQLGVPELVMVAAFTAALGTLGLSEAAFWNTAVELGGRNGGTAAALMNTGGNGIGLLAPVVTPLLASKLGWGAGIAVAGLVCIAGAVCWLWIRPNSATNASSECGIA